MPYSQFTNISKAKEAFELKTKEGGRFIPPTQPIEPSATLTAYLQESLLLAASASETTLRCQFLSRRSGEPGG